MLYIERNKIITAEIRNGVKINPGKVIGTSLSGTETLTAGSYFSPTLNQELFLALKTKTAHIDPEFGWIYNMAAHAALYDNVLLLQPELPAFLSLVRNSGDRGVSYLTEDFSQGGKYEVKELSVYEVKEIADVKSQIVEVFRDDPTSLSDEEVVNMFFWVKIGEQYQRRIGDLDKAMVPVGARRRLSSFPIIHLMETQEAHTLSLD